MPAISGHPENALIEQALRDFNDMLYDMYERVRPGVEAPIERLRRKLGAVLRATTCRTCATRSELLQIFGDRCHDQLDPIAIIDDAILTAHSAQCPALAHDVIADLAN